MSSPRPEINPTVPADALIRQGMHPLCSMRSMCHIREQAYGAEQLYEQHNLGQLLLFLSIYLPLADFSFRIILRMHRKSIKKAPHCAAQ